MERLIDDTTIPEASRGRVPSSPPNIGLVVVWCANDPLRLGTWLPARHMKGTIGRGALRVRRAAVYRTMSVPAEGSAPTLAFRATTSIALAAFERDGDRVPPSVGAQRRRRLPPKLSSHAQTRAAGSRGKWTSLSHRAAASLPRYTLRTKSRSTW
jgi:hypothetical protein